MCLCNPCIVMRKTKHLQFERNSLGNLMLANSSGAISQLFCGKSSLWNTCWTYPIHTYAANKLNQAWSLPVVHFQEKFILQDESVIAFHCPISMTEFNWTGFDKNSSEFRFIHDFRFIHVFLFSVVKCSHTTLFLSMSGRYVNKIRVQYVIRSLHLHTYQ